MAVSLRNRDALVAQQLHSADIDPLHDEAAGKAVTQIVPAQVLDPSSAPSL
jgi:hypothetical protein